MSQAAANQETPTAIADSARPLAVGFGDLLGINERKTNMKNWIVKVLNADGTWLQWSANNSPGGGYWSNHQPPLLMEKLEAVEMAKRVFNDVEWVYGVKIVENL